MKVNIIDEYNTIVFLNQNIIKFIDFSDVENEINKLFNKLKNNYDIKTSGYFDIDIYVDDNYGSILDIKREKLDCIDYFEKSISMEIKIINNEFLYELDDIYEDLKSFIVYNNKLYTNNFHDIRISEHARVIYGDEIDKIIKYGKKISL